MELTENLPMNDNTQERKDLRRLFSAAGWSFFVYMLLSQAGAYGMAKLYNAMEMGGTWPVPQQWTLWLISYLPTYLVAFPVFLLMLRRIPKQPAPARKKVRVIQFLALAVVCFGAMYAANLVTVALLALVETLSGLPMTNPLEAVADGGLASILFGVVIAPVMEELTFRKLLLDRLRGAGEGICILASGFIFALFHGNLSQMFYAFVLGSIFAYVALRTGGIRITIPLHMMVNAIGMVLAPRLVASGDLMLTALLGFFVMAMIAAATVIVLARRRHIKLYPGGLPLSEREKRGCFFGSSGMIAYMLLIVALVVVTIVLTL